MARFLDTNVLLRYFSGDDPVKGEHALRLLRGVERGEERVLISPMVVFETVYSLHRSYKMSKVDIRQVFWPIIALPGVQLAEKSLFREALDLYAGQNISFADAYHTVWMQRRGVTEVYSGDREFDRIPALTRIEPSGP